MAQLRENGSTPTIATKGTITDNVAFLSKFLIIRQNHSIVYKEISENNIPPSKWITVFTLKSNKADKDNKGDYEAFIDFQMATLSVTVKDIRPFIYLKQSDMPYVVSILSVFECYLLNGLDMHIFRYPEGTVYDNKH